MSDIFPTVSFNFAGSASIMLKPEEYLMHLGFTVSSFSHLPYLSDSCLFVEMSDVVTCHELFNVGLLGISGRSFTVVPRF